MWYEKEKRLSLEMTNFFDAVKPQTKPEVNGKLLSGYEFNIEPIYMV